MRVYRCIHGICTWIPRVCLSRYILTPRLCELIRGSLVVTSRKQFPEKTRAEISWPKASFLLKQNTRRTTGLRQGVVPSSRPSYGAWLASRSLEEQLNARTEKRNSPTQTTHSQRRPEDEHPAAPLHAHMHGIHSHQRCIYPDREAGPPQSRTFFGEEKSVFLSFCRYGRNETALDPNMEHRRRVFQEARLHGYKANPTREEEAVDLPLLWTRVRKQRLSYLLLRSLLTERCCAPQTLLRTCEARLGRLSLPCAYIVSRV